ncbi:hypothetical protein PLICRDRAFT_659206 [Plicaturopsis crispa FD-325 SS-3]|nr:hypothetical protein PLICRDRAFT_659206 [Plicaturopsis crispa FD-325 SS-3]
MTDFLQDVDLETARLISSLLLDDLADVEATSKGKRRADATPPDAELALRAQSESLRSELMMFEDYCLAKSLDAALQRDRGVLETLCTVDQAEHDDHAAADALSRGQALPPLTASQRRMEEIVISPDSDDDDLSDSGEESSNERAEGAQHRMGTGNRHPSSSKIRPSGTKSRALPRVDCVICTDSLPMAKSFRAPCGHYYCRKCLVSLVEAATRDESLFPVRCCQQNIPTDAVSLFARSPTLMKLFQERCVEFGTPSSERLYCAKASCSAFIGPAPNLEANVVCAKCETIVCSLCKDIAHPNQPCGENAATLEVRALATAEHWQTCPGCHALVELHSGCYHITCRCRKQFCYLCAADWKTCGCVQWDEPRLLVAAERQVVNQFGARAAQARPEAHAERVRHRAADLRVDHECVRHNFVYRHGGGMCELCGDTLPLYMIRCTNCQTLACRRCAQNRL